MKFAKSFLLSLSLVLVAPSEAAQQLVLNYDGFFDRLEDLDEPEYSKVTLGFYFKEIGSNEPCKMTSVKLKSQSESKDVYFYPSGEVLLPFDEQLDMDKAKLIISHETSHDCGLDMRLESKALLSKTIKSQEAEELLLTFDAALDELAGMMSFLLPDVAGVTFLASEGQKLTLDNPHGIECDELGCTVLKSELEGLNDTLRFNVVPKKAVPFIKK